MTVPVGVLGASGLVGQRLLARLGDHPTFEPVSVAASDDRVGERYGDSVTWRIDEALPPAVADLRFDPADPDGLGGDPGLVLSALPGAVARDIEAAFAESGALVCSNASPGRMDDDVPLLIPELNADHLGLIEHQRDARGWAGALVKNPNCSTVTVALPLSALVDLGLEAATVVTMQAISGAGTAGVHGIDIVDNVLPDIPGEADKLADEPRKLLGSLADGAITPHPVAIDAACHRVPVIDGHLASCFVELGSETSASAVAAAFGAVPAVDLPSAPARPIHVIDAARRPQPRYDRDAGDGMAVAVGPIDVVGSRVRFTCLAHNTIRGAAGACLLAAEAAVDAGYGP